MRRTGCEEVLVMLRLVQRMVRVRRKDRGRHQWVSVLQDGHPGGQAATERRGDDLPQRLGLVQYVVNEKRRGSLRRRRRRVVQAHCVGFDGFILFRGLYTCSSSICSPPQPSPVFNSHAA